METAFLILLVGLSVIASMMIKSLFEKLGLTPIVGYLLLGFLIHASHRGWEPLFSKAVGIFEVLVENGVRPTHLTGAALVGIGVYSRVKKGFGRIMGRPLRVEFPGAFYHVTSRGNEKKAIFRGKPDREKFLSYLESATQRYGLVVHVYCLMDNHYHLFVETPLGNLSRIMQHINGAYTNYFNKKYNRSGHLFQGRYKAILVEVDEYAKELSRYIHLNPVRAGKVRAPEAYKWSSCRFYTIAGKAPDWLNRGLIFSYFGQTSATAKKAYRAFVHSLIDQEYESPLDEVRYSVFLGGPDFVDEIKKNCLKDKKPDRELSALRKMVNRPGLDKIEHLVDSVVQSDDLLGRQLKLYLCHRFSGKRLKEIGQRFGVGESAVSQASRRIRIKQRSNEKIKEVIVEISKKLGVSSV